MRPARHPASHRHNVTSHPAYDLPDKALLSSRVYLTSFPAYSKTRCYTADPADMQISRSRGHSVRIITCVFLFLALFISLNVLRVLVRLSVDGNQSIEMLLPSVFAVLVVSSFLSATVLGQSSTASSSPSVTSSSPFTIYTISADNITAKFIPYGARLTSLLVPDRNGTAQDVVAGYDSGERYLTAGTLRSDV